MAVVCCVVRLQGHGCAAVDAPAVEPPVWLKSALKEGRVKVEFSDPVTTRRPFPGWTEFEFKLNFRYEYQYKYRELSSRKFAVTISPSFRSITFPVKHEIQLPKTLDSPRWFEFSLARHELDHVVIGSQPRLKLLGERLIHRITRIERQVFQTREITNDWVNKVVDEEVALRTKAMTALVRDINAQLDRLTNHGSRPLHEPEVWFANLYSKEQLDELKFPYLADMAELLDSPAYEQAGWKADSFPLTAPARK